MEFRAGRVLAQSISVYGRNLLGFVLLGLVVSAPVWARELWVVSTDDLYEMIERSQSWRIFWQLLGAAIGFFIQGTVVYSVFQQLHGERVPLSRAVSTGLRRVPAVTGTVLVLVLAILGAALPGFFLGATIGSPVLAIAGTLPALFVYVLFFICVPVTVVERPGAVASLKRSQELTEGHRWGIFGLILVTAVLKGVVLLIIQRAATGEFSYELDLGTLRVATGVELLLSLVFDLFGAVVVAIAYHDLRLEKDGVSVDELAAVFD